MEDNTGPRRVLLSIGIAAAVCAACGGPGTDHGDPRKVPPSSAEARQLLDTTVRLARAGDTGTLCRIVAAAEPMCRSLLESAAQSHLSAGHEVPRVLDEHLLDEPHSTPTLVLRLAGTHDDGREYTSDFAVIRDQSGIRSMTAIYWSEVQFAPRSPPATTSR
ncbi:hypothetical protein ACFWY9_17520 [Amycolatopsis sp. NPDC059027]|uniref:hypothetical protein n=1 Tax=Amycolatopsis sp. NPDC059027 TaxID=3346709 RepID=UPI003670A247